MAHCHRGNCGTIRADTRRHRSEQIAAVKVISIHRIILFSRFDFFLFFGRGKEKAMFITAFITAVLTVFDMFLSIRGDAMKM